MRTLQNQCVANKGVIRQFRKRQEIENKELDQYEETIRILDEELTLITTKLKEESHLREEAEKVKTNLTTKLTTLREQTEKAKADAVPEFRLSQPFFDACGVYYGNRFDDCLKQVGSVYTDLVLSRITIDDIVLQMPRRDDNVSDEPYNSSHTIEQKAKDDGVVIGQPAPESAIAPMVLSTVDSSIEGGQSIMNQAILDVLRSQLFCNF